MTTRARAVAAANHGLITRAQALDAGMSPLSIKHALVKGELVPVRHGVYALGDVWEALDEFGGRQLLLARAAIRTMRREWVASHDSSAHAHHLPILVPPDPHVHITRPGFTGAWSKAGVKHHLARFSDDQVVEVEDLRALDLARTAVDMAREHGTPYGEIACDAVMRRGVTRAELEAAVAPMDHWPHVERTRDAVAFADPGAESLVETLGRILVTPLGMGDVETQFPVRLDNGRVLWGDIRVGCHLFECDGLGKYVSVARGGFAERPAEEVVWDEKKRERSLHRIGLGTSRFIAADYFNPRRDEVLARMRAEVEDTIARFGPRLPDHLERNARELRGRRGA